MPSRTHQISGITTLPNLNALPSLNVSPSIPSSKSSSRLIQLPDDDARQGLRCANDNKLTATSHESEVGIPKLKVDGDGRALDDTHR